MKKIGIYGGTFSPPHLGHRHAVEAFASSLALDEVIVMPVNIPPHKQAFEEVDAAMRLAMTRIAFRDLSYVTVSDWEIEAGEISYTANTLCHFAPMGELYFLCGGDMFLTLPDWYRPDLIFQHAVIAVASRDADQDEALRQAAAAYRENFGARICLLPLAPWPLSSTAVRDAVAAGDAIDTMVAPGVAAYIKALGLYRPQPPLPLSQAMIDTVAERETPARMKHTLGVVQECLTLARLFDLAQDKTRQLAMAALCHDITKNTPDVQQPCLAKELGLSLSREDLAAPAVLHAFTGAAFAARAFPRELSREACEAIRVHTTGKPAMTLFEKLLFLADFIEPGRTHAACRRMRRRFYMTVPLAQDPLAALDAILLDTMREQRDFVLANGGFLHPATAAAIAYLEASGAAPTENAGGRRA